jgi:DNA-cytosine methyltransferase
MIKHFSAFAGIGGACSALEQAGADFSTVGISEINKQACHLRHAIIGDNAPNIGDINKKNWEKEEIDLYTGGFPCQPFSLLGLRKGMQDPRAQAMLSMQQMILDVKPKYVLLENVAGIMTAKQWPEVRRWLTAFRGYSIHVHKSNPHDLGYLQSRTRVFIALSRNDMRPWIIPDQLPKLAKRQTWGAIKDKKVNPSEFISIVKKPRIVYVADDTTKKFQCFTRRAIDSHCGRATWITHGNGYRGPTPAEFFRLFGYANPPQIKIQKGRISRSSIGMGFGNSWHVGHAGLILETLPIQ